MTTSSKTYDVFISYRRDKGADLARNLQQALEKLGLKVFFDMEELTDGQFNVKIYDAIKQSKNAIFLMTEGALERCVNEGDWVRNELERVVECGINLVLVVPSGTEIVFPTNLPEKLSSLPSIEASELNRQKLFKESVEKIAYRLKDVVIINDKEKKEAEDVFLSMARRLKENDGVIDANEMKQLENTAKKLGISEQRSTILIEQIEQEYLAQRAMGVDLMPPMPETVHSFDIFISYRRDGGASDAMMMYQRLTDAGYSVSFDMDNLKNGNFNEELLRRIAECKNFIILLNKGCFDRTLKGCKREDDWLRIELATALYNKKNVIAVQLDGFDFNQYPKLPPDIEEVRHKNGPKYDIYYLDSFYDKLKRDFLIGNNGAGEAKAEQIEENILPDETPSKEHDTSLDDILGDDAAYWREEAEPTYRSVSRIQPYQELKKLDEAWNSAEENITSGDHKLATRRYMEVMELVQKLKSCSSPFVTRIVGDGIDIHAFDWFEKVLEKAQAGDKDYQYGVGTLYSAGLGVEKDSSAAFRWFERASAQEHIQAMTAVGAAYASGEGVEINYIAARKILLRAEKKGEVHAIERLGYLYEKGLGVRRSYSVALNKYKTAANLGNSSAMVALGKMFEEGLGIEADYEKAIAWYRLAVANGSAVAQRKMSEFLFAGKGVDKNEKEAVNYARLAANQGDSDAIAILGRAYENGAGVTADASKAEELYRKAVECGSTLGKLFLSELEAEAQYRNGVKYLEGVGVKQDFTVARMWFERSAAQGNVSSMEQLGSMDERGLGGDVNVLTAKEWYEKAETKGNAAAMVGLGKLYFQGYDGIIQDYQKAADYFKKAAALWRNVEDENKWKVLRAFYYLGRIYTEGLGVEIDLSLGNRCYVFGAHNEDILCARALGINYECGIKGCIKSKEHSMMWYAKCAQIIEDNNISFADERAMFAVGTLYSFGGGVKKNMETSVEWLTKGAALGSVDCSYRMAVAYRRGEGVPKNIKKALAYYEEAAKRGDLTAQNTISWIYYTGEGVLVDYEKALYWGTKSAQGGNGEAMETLYRMYRDGNGVEKNETGALKWLKAAADKESGAAFSALGDCYEYGKLGIVADMVEAVKLYQKAADRKNIRGMYCLALCYWQGRGIEKDKEKAWRLIVDIVKGKPDSDLHYDEKAIVFLAEMYYGQEGFKVNEKHFHELDSEINNMALYKLGAAYGRAKTLPHDIDHCVECYLAAAEHGDDKAQNNIGFMYYQGTEIERDDKKAFEWTMKAVQNGSPCAMETLFRMYRDGIGVPNNSEEAFKWLEIAARNEDGESSVPLSELGECYEYGLLGRPKDINKAFECYYKASGKLWSHGKYNRGRCHLYGIGTPIDVPRAIDWLTKAAEAGDFDDFKYDLLAMNLLVRIYTDGSLLEKDELKAQEWQRKLDELKSKRIKEIPGYVSLI